MNFRFSFTEIFSCVSHVYHMKDKRLISHLDTALQRTHHPFLSYIQTNNIYWCYVMLIQYCSFYAPQKAFLFPKHKQIFAVIWLCYLTELKLHKTFSQAHSFGNVQIWFAYFRIKTDIEVHDDKNKSKTSNKC